MGSFSCQSNYRKERVEAQLAHSVCVHGCCYIFFHLEKRLSFLTTLCPCFTDVCPHCIPILGTPRWGKRGDACPPWIFSLQTCQTFPDFNIPESHRFWAFKRAPEFWDTTVSQNEPTHDLLYSTVITELKAGLLLDATRHAL